MAIFLVMGILVLPLFVALPIAPIVLFPTIITLIAFSVWTQQSSLIGNSVPYRPAIPGNP